jgi:hypothetical protein
VCEVAPSSETVASVALASTLSVPASAWLPPEAGTTAGLELETGPLMPPWSGRHLANSPAELLVTAKNGKTEAEEWQLLLAASDETAAASLWDVDLVRKQ